MEVIGVGVGILAIMALTYKRIPIGYAMFVATGLVIVFSRMDIARAVLVFRQALFADMTVTLVLIVFFIGILGSLLKRTNSLDMMLNKLSSLISDARVLIILLPSLIGLLTVPGGAVLSAPMVAEAGSKINLPKERSAAVNVVYRHLWYFVFPLYPSLIFITELANVRVHQLILFHVPVVLIVLVLSFNVLFRGIDKSQLEDKGERTAPFIKEMGGLFRSILPIIVSVGLALILDVYLPLAVLCGIIVAYVNFLDFSKDKSELLKVLKTRLGYVRAGMDFNMVLTILGIMVFKDFVEASGAVKTITESLVTLGIPLPVLVVVTPLLTGMLTGNHIAGIGIVYPILSPLFPEANHVPLIGLMFSGGVTGYMISPLHLCLILTKEYFQIPFGKLYVQVLPLILMIVVGAGVTAFIWGIF